MEAPTTGRRSTRRRVRVNEAGMSVEARRLGGIGRALLLALGCSLAACGGESRVETPIDFGDIPPVSSENLAEVSAHALCGPLEGCCGRWGLPFDRGRCEAVLEQYFAPSVERIQRGSAELDETAARRCLAELEGSLASCTLDDSVSCRRALIGTTKAEGACTHDEECDEPSDGNAVCFSEGCGFRRRARLGEPCSYTCRDGLELFPGAWPASSMASCNFAAIPQIDVGCFRDDGLYCLRSSARCERLLDEGSECIQGQCQMHLYCAEGTCRQRGSLGQSCPSTQPSTVEPPCADGLTCADDERCTDRLDRSVLFDPSEVCGTTPSE
jgi:hypothetical protein